MGGIIKGINRESNLSTLIKEHEMRTEPPQVNPPQVDRSLIDNGVWERATFTVPSDVSDERVQESARKYRSKAASAWEAQGFTIMEMLGPNVAESMPGDPPDRKRYSIFGFLRRRPVELTFDVPDVAVVALAEKGLKPKRGRRIY